MENIKILDKIEKLKEIFNELKVQFEIYEKQSGILKKTAYFAVQKKLEETIEYSIKINRELLKNKKVFVNSYQESFLKLEIYDIDKEICKELSSLAVFRNKLAHDYIIISEEETINKTKKTIKLIPKYLKEIINII